MLRRIIYIINPISGTRKKSGLREKIEEKTRQKNISYKFFPSVASGDYSFLKAIIREEEVTDVVVVGGDGTLNGVVGSLMNEDVNFGIVPCGSGNGLARAAGIPRQPLKALDIIFNGRAQAIDGFYVNGQFSCMLTGLGFDASVAHEFAGQGKRGFKTYALITGKKFFSAKPYRFKIKSKNLEFFSEAYFISIANSNQFGNNFTIAPKAVLSDGLLDIVIAKKTAKPILVFNVLKQVFAGRLQKIESREDFPIIYFQTNELSIENPDHAPLHIDGDPCETFEKLEIKVLPGCFHLIQPL